MSEQDRKNLTSDTEGQKEYDLPYSMKLREPIPFGKEQTITEIVFSRRLKAKDLMGIKLQDMKFDDMFKLISRLTAQPMVVVGELDGEDMMAAMDVVNSFLPSGLKTE